MISQLGKFVKMCQKYIYIFQDAQFKINSSSTLASARRDVENSEKSSSPCTRLGGTQQRKCICNTDMADKYKNNVIGKDGG